MASLGALAEEYIDNMRERDSAEATIEKNKWLLPLWNPISADGASISRDLMRNAL